MSIERLKKDMNIIAKLDDEPNDVGGLTAAQLKGKFDEGGVELGRYLNEVLLPALEAAGVEHIVRNDADGRLVYLRVDEERGLEYSADHIRWHCVHEMTILPERELAFAAVEGKSYYRHDLTGNADNAAYFTLVQKGCTCCVEWDGVLYEVVERLPDSFGEMPGVKMLGNLSIMGSEYEDTGEPFVFVGIDAWMDGAIGGSDALGIYTNDPSASHTVRVYRAMNFRTAQEEVNDLRLKMIKNALPAVTSEDNGKFLRVDYGVWTAQSVASAEEASF